MRIQEAVVRAAQRGDKQAQEEMYQQCFPMIVGVTQRLLRHREDALDVAQEVFFRVFAQNKLASFRFQAEVTTWLIQIARNICFAKLKEKIRRSEVFPRDEFVLDREWSKFVCHENPEDHFIRQEQLNKLHGIVFQLPEKLATCLQLYFSDYSYAEAAQRMNITRTHYGLIKSRAKDKLAKVIREKMQEKITKVLVAGHSQLQIGQNCCWDAM